MCQPKGFVSIQDAQSARDIKSRNKLPEYGGWKRKGETGTRNENAVVIVAAVSQHVGRAGAHYKDSVIASIPQSGLFPTSGVSNVGRSCGKVGTL